MVVCGVCGALKVLMTLLLSFIVKEKQAFVLCPDHQILDVYKTFTALRKLIKCYFFSIGHGK